MALRQLMLQKQISDKENELNELRKKDGEFVTREQKIEKAIEEANTEEERSVVDTEITTFTEERDAHNKRKDMLGAELEELRGKMKEYEEQPQKAEERKKKWTREVKKSWKKLEVGLMRL